jgi:hypothetical protein
LKRDDASGRIAFSVPEKEVINIVARLKKSAPGASAEL